MKQKIVRVKMNDLNIIFENVPEEYVLLGGRGLTSRIINQEVAPNCDPFDSENKFVIAPGLLTGTNASCSGRLSMGAKSPLTGGIKESNVGGTAGQSIARIGIRALIIEEKAEPGKSYILEISKGKIDFKEAIEIENKTNYEVSRYIMEKYGVKTPYVSIGPAGEKRLSLASVAVSDLNGNPARHAGRGGLGAVLGSKGIKAIVFLDKGENLKAQDVVNFNETRKSFAKTLPKAKKAFTKYGTAMMVDVINEIGGLTINNFRYGQLDDAGPVSAETLAANCKNRGGQTGHACHKGCVIRCSNIYHDSNNEYLTSSLEYETIGLLGLNCGLHDLDQIAELDYICDDYGLDTIETGCTLAVAMEGELLKFGDFKGMKKLINEMIEGTVTGKLLGQGTYVTGKTLGVERIPTVKKQSLAAYDPRALKGNGVTYATSPMGADHTAGNCVPGRTGLDDRDGKGQVKASKKIQVLSTLCDNLGLCIFVGPVPENLQFMTDLLNSFTGKNLSEKEVLSLAEQILKDEVSFNERAGLTKYQNDLPKFFRTEELHSGLVFDVDQKELRNIYQ